MSSSKWYSLLVIINPERCVLSQLISFTYFLWRISWSVGQRGSAGSFLFISKRIIFILSALLGILWVLIFISFFLIWIFLKIRVSQGKSRKLVVWKMRKANYFIKSTLKKVIHNRKFEWTWLFSVSYC